MLTRWIRSSALVLLALATLALPARAGDPENTLLLQLKDGMVVIELRPDLARRTVAHIKELVRSKFYDGVVFHRVISGFMAQTGDPTGSGEGGSGVTVPGEFSDTLFERGSVGLARSQSKDSGDSQFFICFDRRSSLDGNYAYFGKVVSGMEFVDKIKKGESSMNGRVFNPDKIITLRIAADVQKPGAKN
jgi:peptidylprolyl isomerase